MCPFLDGIAGEKASATVAQSGRSGKSKVGPAWKTELIGGKLKRREYIWGTFAAGIHVIVIPQSREGHRKKINV